MRKGKDLGATSSDRLRRPPSPKGEGKRETILTAFGNEGWRWKARRSFTAAQVVAALWVAQNDSGKERLRDLIRWAWRLK